MMVRWRHTNADECLELTYQEVNHMVNGELVNGIEILDANKGSSLCAFLSNRTLVLYDESLDDDNIRVKFHGAETWLLG